MRANNICDRLRVVGMQDRRQDLVIIVATLLVLAIMAWLGAHRKREVFLLSPSGEQSTLAPAHDR